ncbi:ABC transporter ATP-binding protein, partial [Gammaproteobacteria bacterium]|nr:ABC transporter ATP-binding protein [Gammaproteobacteria bacterium]
KNGTTALDNINLKVEEGDFFALLGPNGAGKSTAIGILCSLITKTSGSVKIFGYDIDKHLQKAKSCIGVVPQEINFHPFEKILNVLINQAGFYGISEKFARKRAEYFLKKMRLWDQKNNSVLKLSGGMKRRLMIARALINDPKLLILDEPTAGVDIEIRYSVWSFLSELNNNGTTIILTTHYLEEAEQLCKNIAIIDHGQIIEKSNMKSMLNQLHIQTIIFDTYNNLPESLDLPDYNFNKIDHTTFEIDVSKNQNFNNLFKLFDEKDISIKSIRNKTNRLEELFVRLIKQNKDRKI